MVEVILAKIGDAALGALAGKVTEKVWTRLNSDPTKKAFRLAIGAAVHKYTTSAQGQGRLELVKPLLQKGGFLTFPQVAEEIAQLIHFERTPNAELIGKYWKASIDLPPAWCDFTHEAQQLLNYLEAELRDTDVFRPVFDSKSLDKIAINTVDISASLTRIEAQLADAFQLLTTQYGDLMRAFAGANFDLQGQIRDYSRFLQEKTYDFVGRRFVFDAVDRFIAMYPRGYYIIRGDPGIGKSALAAYLVRNRGYVHHFNIQSEGINKTETFLRNICAQLIVAYHLNHRSLPPEATADSGFLNRLLAEASEKLTSQEKLVIVIDALDEVDTSHFPSGPNILYLPATLPQNVYIIMTTRRMSLNLRIECEQETFEIKPDAANRADIREYVEHAVGRLGIQTYIARQGIDNEFFIDHLVEKSEGNFMYIRYVLPDIERGVYSNLGLETLPTGLQNYYEDHWRRIHNKSKEDTWFQYKLPIISVLAAYQEPISLDRLSQFSHIQEKGRIVEVLHEWAQFLHVDVNLQRDSSQKVYSIYHTSFRDFLLTEDEIASNVKEAHKTIKDTLWTELWME